jgi:hypothetical protein
LAWVTQGINAQGKGVNELRERLRNFSNWRIRHKGFSSIANTVQKVCEKRRGTIAPNIVDPDSATAWIRIQQQPGSGFSNSLDPDSVTTWIRIQQQPGSGFSNSRDPD